MQNQLIPQLKESGLQQLIVAHPTQQEMQDLQIHLPSGAYLTPKPLISKKVAVRHHQHEEYAAAFISARWPKDQLHCATMPVLGFILEGDVVMPFGDYRLHCKPGHAFLILPGTPYSDGAHLCLEENAPDTAVCSMFSIRAWRQGVACWLNHTQKGVHWCDVIQGEYCQMLNPQIRYYLENLSSELTNQSPQYREIGAGIFQAMMFMLWRELQQRRFIQPTQTHMDTTEILPQSADESIRRAQEYIHHNLHLPLNINVVAAQVYMSRAYFTRKFRKVTGITFNTYLKQYRLNTAKLLLENTGYSIEDVGRQIGISGNHLRLLFQQNLGMTPHDYRRDNRKKITSS